MRLIDGDALKNRKFTTNECNGFGEGHAYRQGWNDAIDAIMDNEITVEPERKKGKWIYGEKSGQDGWYCSECGGFIPWYYNFYGLGNIDFIEDFNTCPFCDSKMLSHTGGDMRQPTQHCTEDYCEIEIEGESE